jgi:molecular chaperone GrpE (heat shock protein)
MVENEPHAGSEPRAARSFEDVAKAVDENAGQTALLRQQVVQLHNQVAQLYGAVSAQCVQLRDSDQALLQELQRFQTGGPQRAMTAVYTKLFRDLLRHMNQLDELATLNPDKSDKASEAWITALKGRRDHFEGILKDWGCLPVAVRIGEDFFDPERHEAAQDPARGPALGTNRIVAVSRRGWVLGDTILQFPLVVTD